MNKTAPTRFPIQSQDDDGDLAKIGETSSHATGNSYEIDPLAERRLLRKFDWYLLPLFTLLCE